MVKDHSQELTEALSEEQNGISSLDEHKKLLADYADATTGVRIDLPIALREVHFEEDLLNKLIDNTEKIVSMSERILKDQPRVLSHEVADCLATIDLAFMVLEDNHLKEHFAGQIGIIEDRMRELAVRIEELHTLELPGTSCFMPLVIANYVADEKNTRSLSALLLARIKNAIKEKNIKNSFGSMMPLIRQCLDSCKSMIEASRGIMIVCHANISAAMSFLWKLQDVIRDTKNQIEVIIMFTKWKTHEAMKSLESAMRRIVRLLLRISRSINNARNQVQRKAIEKKDNVLQSARRLSFRKKLAIAGLFVPLFLGIAWTGKYTFDRFFPKHFVNSYMNPDVIRSPRPNLTYLKDGMLFNAKGCINAIINLLSEGESYDAQRIRHAVKAVFHVSGNAWTMFNIMTTAPDHRGTVVFNSFPEIFQKSGPQIKDITLQIRNDHSSNSEKQKKYASQIRAFFINPGIDLSKLEVGDIIGLYYDNSPNQIKAFLQGTGYGGFRTFNTHGGVVVSVGGPGSREVIVAHWIDGRLYLEDASTLLTKNNRFKMLITWAVRPDPGIKIFKMGLP